MRNVSNQEAREVKFAKEGKRKWATMTINENNAEAISLSNVFIVKKFNGKEDRERKKRHSEW